ncbi:MAG: hypothetical protein CMJ90_03185 [Planctomycetes bacterium]|nr:hypothetical protein [Planctomycetota bacterium]
MQCPQCKQPLVIVECDHVELDVCFDGHGIWFDADELRQLFELAGARERDSGMEARFDHLSAHSGPKRRCPRCRGRMRHVEAPGASEGVILDECPKGHGLWFDEGELHEVLSAELGEGDEAIATIKRYLGSFCEPRKEESSDG